VSPTFLFNAPPHHEIVFPDRVVHGGETLEVAEGTDPALIDARLIPTEGEQVTESPESEQPVEAAPAEQVTEPAGGEEVPSA